MLRIPRESLLFKMGFWLLLGFSFVFIFIALKALEILNDAQTGFTPIDILTYLGGAIGRRLDDPSFAGLLTVFIACIYLAPAYGKLLPRDSSKDAMSQLTSSGKKQPVVKRDAEVDIGPRGLYAWLALTLIYWIIYLSLVYSGNGAFFFVWGSGGKPELSPRYIGDLKSFVGVLASPTNAISQYIRQQFSADTKALIDTFRDNEKVIDTGKLRVTLVKELNETILSTNLLYTPDRFQGIKLGAETTNLLARFESLLYLDICWLNRRSLQDAFPGCILSNATYDGGYVIPDWKAIRRASIIQTIEGTLCLILLALSSAWAVCGLVAVRGSQEPWDLNVYRDIVLGCFAPILVVPAYIVFVHIFESFGWAGSLVKGVSNGPALITAVLFYWSPFLFLGAWSLERIRWTPRILDNLADSIFGKK